MNRSFFRGILAGSIMGTMIGMFSAPQKKTIPENARRRITHTDDMPSRTKRVLKGLSKGVSDIIK